MTNASSTNQLDISRSRFSLKVPLHVLAAGYAIGASYTVSLVGEIYVSELLALAVLPFIRPHKIIKSSWMLRKVLFGYCIILTGLVISDYYNSSEINNYLRGSANIIFAGVNLIFLFIIIINAPNTIITWLVTTVLVKFMLGEHSLENYTYLIPENDFKSKIVPYLEPSVILLGCLLAIKSRRLPGPLFCVSGAVMVIMGARSSGAVLLISGLALIMSGRKTLSKRKILVSGVLLGVLGVCAYLYYVDLVLSGNIASGVSHSVNQIRRMENPYNPIELLMLGRSQTFVALEAISERPVFGFGSWAPDIGGKYARLVAEMQNSERRLPVYYTPWIPSHSVLFTAWLWAGLLGLCGMLVVVSAVLRAILDNIRNNHYLSPAFYAFSIGFFWHLLFSPFGHVRTSFPITIAVVGVFAMGRVGLPRIRSRRLPSSRAAR